MKIIIIISVILLLFLYVTIRKIRDEFFNSHKIKFLNECYFPTPIFDKVLTVYPNLKSDDLKLIEQGLR